MKPNIKSIIKVAETIICIIFFFLEIWVIFNLFMSFSNKIEESIFWLVAAMVSTCFHLYIIFKIKTAINEKKWIAIAFILIYLVILAVFLLSVLGFALRSVTKGSEVDHFETAKNNRIMQTIEGNELAIKKYNELIKSTNDIKTVLKWRYQVNELTTINNKLTESILNGTNGIQLNESDPFQLIASKIGQPKEIILFWFLIALWFLFEIGLFMTAPTIGNNQKTVSVDGNNKDLKADIIKHIASIRVYVDNILVNEAESRIASNANISKKTMLKMKECKIIRGILLQLKNETGENIIRVEPGYCGLICSKDELLNIINELEG